MNLLSVVLVSAVCLLLAYVTYGRLLARLLQLSDSTKTPAVTMRDDVDYMPIEPKFLLSQHFSAIAAAGPIVGPIFAGVMFGWVPALLWILVGSIFIGGVHDITALVASIRHRAQSIAEVVRDHMSRRSYLLFLSFVWLALVYIIVAFTDITAASFVGRHTLENGQQVLGGGIATSSLLYLVLPLVMGVLLRYTRLTVGWATLIFLPLVGVAIWVGQHLPLDLAAVIARLQPSLSPADAETMAHKAWDVLLLGYCLIAAVVPMWLLLQPRGHLGGYFLYVTLAGGAVGLMFSGETIRYPQWITPTGPAAAQPLFPFLFITIACGACSGFHSLIASGTTSKQLRRESDARVVGYGAMLLEGMVAVVSLCCVMVLAQDSPAVARPQPNMIYALGIGNFLETFHIPPAFAVSFALMAFTTFVYDTLDVCTRLGRYIIQELTGWRSRKGAWFATGLTAGVPLAFVMQTRLDAKGLPEPVWKTFWPLFGASNQLLAALTLLGVTIWLWRTRRAAWVWLVTGIPTVWMYVVSTWALVLMIWPAFRAGDRWLLPRDLVPWIGAVLVALAAMMLVEALIIIFRPGPSRPSKTPGELAPAASPA